MTGNELIAQAFVKLAVIQPGDVLPNPGSLLTDGQTNLNVLLSQLSTEEKTSYMQQVGVFNLISGQTAYTFGTGGNWVTIGVPMRVKTWHAYYSTLLNSGGRVLSFEEFGIAAADAQPLGETAPVPKILCADSAYPTKNIRVLPPPGQLTGQVEITYDTPIPAITDFTIALTFPDGWLQLLIWNLALMLYPSYARPGQSAELIAGMAQSTKATIVAQNTMGGAPAGAQQ